MSKIYMQYIKKHFFKYFQKRPWNFCWKIGVESTVVSTIAGILLFMLGTPERVLPNWSMWTMFFVIVILAPVLETLLMQALPIFIARKANASFKTQVIIGTIVFSIMHLKEGWGTFISAGIVGGFYFSFAYAYWRRKTRWQAFWVTAGSHAIHNAIAFILILFFN